MKSEKDSKKFKTEWKKIGYLNKTKRADMLRGKIFIDELDLSFEVVAFVKNDHSKKHRDEDIRILLPIETQNKDIF